MRRWVRAGRLRPRRFWRGGLGRSGPRRATPAAAKSASSLLEAVPEAAPVSAGTAAEAVEMRTKLSMAAEQLEDRAEVQRELELAQHKLNMLYGDMCSYSDEVRP